LVQVGLGYTNIARLALPVVVVVNLGAVVVMMAFVRLGLHHVLLHEHHDFAIGPPRMCTSCRHVVPAMPFCPQCGVAQHAMSKAHRRREFARFDEQASAAQTGSATQ
jgi:rRNA maturation endonuclease Nob1